MHAIVELTKTATTLIDLEGEGGTYVNGARIHRTDLAPGDAIQMGGTTLRVWRRHFQ